MTYSYVFNLIELKDALYSLFEKDDDLFQFVKDDYQSEKGENIVYHLLTLLDERDSVTQVENKIVEEFKKILDSIDLVDDGLSTQVTKVVRSVLDKDNIEDKFEDFGSYEDYEEYAEAKDNAYDYSQYLRELRSSQIAKSICIAIDRNGNYVALPTESPISISENAANSINTLIQNVANSMSYTVDKVKNLIKAQKFKILTTDKVANL